MGKVSVVVWTALVARVSRLLGVVLVQVSGMGHCAEFHISGISLGQSVASQNITVPSGVSK